MFTPITVSHGNISGCSTLKETPAYALTPIINVRASSLSIVSPSRKVLPTKTTKPSASSVIPGDSTTTISTTTTTTTTVTTPAMATQEPVLVSNPLLCVMGERMAIPNMVPDDGVCDYMFYSDVILRNNSIRAYANPASFATFLEVSKNFTKTMLGFSFHPE